MISEVTLTVDGAELECQVVFIHRPYKQSSMWTPEEPEEMDVVAIECDSVDMDLNWLYKHSEQWRNHVDEQVLEVINA